MSKGNSSSVPGSTPHNASREAPQVTKSDAWRALAALCLGFFMVLMDQTIVAVAMPDIMANFDTEFDQVVWVTSIYLLCMVVPLLFTGRLGITAKRVCSSWASRCSCLQHSLQL